MVFKRKKQIKWTNHQPTWERHPHNQRKRKRKMTLFEKVIITVLVLAIGSVFYHAANASSHEDEQLKIIDVIEIAKKVQKACLVDDNISEIYYDGARYDCEIFRQ